ncbi:cystathionine beta-lyase [Streptococcus cuniculipharyngis]|uniref:Cystathionine beta-lyase n=1 Tax=Streptococcus cuniculipharyngis TaxID=1562651 RepID=A0A5C5SCL3_9STRE|nr:cystathionine beta-lyase [Streptococcus cuniculipharyngis]TWS98022.1 cystathionine beta-lyase [Streptococcus cuniculipharyngis]
MTNMLDLALQYGGFTSLDRTYLSQKFKTMTPEEQLRFITPPPSVLNAYFAEYYQKESPEKATDYYFAISSALDLTTSQPSFREDKPFVRLNLSGKSYGFAYQDRTAEVAQVFAEKPAPITAKLCFELAEIFPQYRIFVDKQVIKMAPKEWSLAEAEGLDLGQALLTEGYRLADGTIYLSSFNQEEILEVAQNFKGQVYYGFHQRQYLLYITE